VRLLLTTRDPDLPHPAYAPSQWTAVLPLGGLIPPEALAFAGEVLDGLGHPRPARPDLERLLDYLGGHPLSIQLVLPHLPEFDNDVATVIARFDELYPGFTEGRARARHESLAVSLSFSLGRLSPAARARLPALGMFEGGALEIAILLVTSLKPSQWREVRAELERAGLVTLDLEMPVRIETEEGPFSGRYLRFHPTLAPHLRARLAPAERRALEARYRQVYYELSGYLYHADDRTPHEARAIARRELANLRRALELTLAAGDVATAVDFADNVEFFLNVFGRWREREAMMAKVAAAVRRPGPAPTGPLTKAEYLLESRQGEMLLDAGRAQEAEQVFRRLLARIEDLTPTPSPARRGDGGEVGPYQLAQTLGRLGRSLRSQGRPRDAEAEYRRMLEVLAGLDQKNPTVCREIGIRHTDLADVLTDQGRYAEAREHYEAALKIHQDQGNERDVAVNLGQLGSLALVQGDYAEARRRYREALDRFRALGETRTEAIGWHQLGWVAEEEAGRATGERRADRLAEAETAYRESLRLEEAIGDKALAATTANQLAIVAQMAGRLADAERWYHRAIELKEQYSTPSDLATSLNNLAVLLLAVHRRPAGERPAEFAGRDLLAEAEEFARKALEIKEAIGDLSLEPWTTYNILAGIAGARGNEAAARDWRRKERAAYVAFPGNWARLARQWGPVVQAVAAAARGDKPARQAVEAAFEAMEAGGWRVSAAFRRIWAGERDWEALVEGLDDDDALIVKKVVEALAGEAGG
jgi:tetratricopeptide (TPR) repeat protein